MHCTDHGLISMGVDGVASHAPTMTFTAYS